MKVREGRLLESSAVEFLNMVVLWINAVLFNFS